MPDGNADVVVCDGFTGNVILKLTEGLAKTLLGMVKEVFLKGLTTKLAYLLVKDGFKDVKKKMDSEEYGGAPLLGTARPAGPPVCGERPGGHHDRGSGRAGAAQTGRKRISRWT